MHGFETQSERISQKCFVHSSDLGLAKSCNFLTVNVDAAGFACPSWIASTFEASWFVGAGAVVTVVGWQAGAL